MKDRKPKRNYRAYSSYVGMRKRCLSPKSDKYYLYGARGIKICERWNSFENFLTDMGERPEGTQLERKDKNKHYEPANCKWSSLQEIGLNRHQRFVEDFTGQRFNDWLVLYRIINNGTKGHGRKYLCRCVCGTEGIFAASKLKTEATKCRKCALKWDRVAAQEFIGKKFNSWTVIGVSEGYSKSGNLLYICECECGKKREMTRQVFEKSQNKSCKNCFYKYRATSECLYCGCRGHKYIDLETSLCDLIGFCSRCDGFDLEKFRKTYKYTS